MLPSFLINRLRMKMNNFITNYRSSINVICLQIVSPKFRTTVLFKCRHSHFLQYIERNMFFITCSFSKISTCDLRNGPFTPKLARFSNGHDELISVKNTIIIKMIPYVKEIENNDVNHVLSILKKICFPRLIKKGS